MWPHLIAAKLWKASNNKFEIVDNEPAALCLARQNFEHHHQSLEWRKPQFNKPYCTSWQTPQKKHMTVQWHPVRFQDHAATSLPQALPTDPVHGQRFHCYSDSARCASKVFLIVVTRCSASCASASNNVALVVCSVCFLPDFCICRAYQDIQAPPKLISGPGATLLLAPLLESNIPHFRLFFGRKNLTRDKEVQKMF